MLFEYTTRKIVMFYAATLFRNTPSSAQEQLPKQSGLAACCTQETAA